MDTASDSGSGVAGGVSSLISSITDAADTTNTNITEALFYKKQREDQAGAIAEDRRRFKIQNDRADREEKLGARVTESKLRGSNFDRFMKTYDFRKQQKSDKTQETLSRAFLQGLAQGTFSGAASRKKDEPAPAVAQGVPNERYR